MLAWKLRIVVLWVSAAVCQSASTYLLLLQPGAVRDLMTGHLAGEDVRSPGVQLLTLLSWVVPMVMAYLTVVLKDADSRTANAMLGGGSAVYAVTTQFPVRDGLTPVGLLVAVAAVLLPLLVLWHAWKWPSPEEVGERGTREDRRPR